MAIGNAANLTLQDLNNLIGDCAVQARKSALMNQALWNYVLSLGALQTDQENALATVFGNQTDANNFWTDANHLAALEQFYFGNLVNPTQFNYDTALANTRGPND